MKRISLERIERILWYGFLVLMPWQARVLLWQADPLFFEWRSMALWASDLIMLSLVIVACWRARGWFVRRMDTFDWILGLLFAAVILSLARADTLAIGVYAAVRFGIGIVWYLYLRHWAFHRFTADESVAWFVVGALLQAGLGCAQFVIQHDCGFRWLGETLLRTDMHGVAVFYNLIGVKVLRAYGTMPHPNVLAAYLACALAGLIWLYARHGRRISVGENMVWISAGSLLLWGMFLTFSRTIIVAWGAAIAILLGGIFWPWVSRRWQNIEIIRERVLRAAAVAIVASVIFLGIFWPPVKARMSIAASDESVQLRLVYAQDAFRSGGRALHINWTGIGIGNFPTWLAEYDRLLPSYLLQPVHNIYLLLYAEIGALGVALWLAWLVLLVRHSWRRWADQPLVRMGVLAMLGAVLFIGMWDHFFLTLQQGRLLWWLVVAISAGPAGHLTNRHQ